MTRTVIIPADCYPLTWPLGVTRTKTPTRSAFQPRTYASAVREVAAIADAHGIDARDAFMATAERVLARNWTANPVTGAATP